MEPVVVAVPEALTGTVSVRVHLLGERIDTRRFERSDAVAAAPLTMRVADRGTAVLFRYGVVVLFGVSAAGEKSFLEQIAPHVIDPFDPRETEEARLRIAPEVDETIDLSGTICLKDASAPRLQLVADVLAKSVVLSHYEANIASIFDRIEPLAKSLREKGRPAGYGRELMRQIGGVLLFEQKIVGRVETSEKPDLLWDRPELERLFVRLADEYELRERAHALERKREAIARAVETLLGLVQSRSSMRVEWYIIALIVAELILSIFPPSLWR